MAAKWMLFVVVSIGLLTGCGTLSHANRNNTTLGLDMRLVKDHEDQEARPYVVLVGEGVLLASNEVSWELSGTLSDGSQFFDSQPDQFFSQSGRYNNPYYPYQAWQHIPEGTSSLVGAVDAPLWIGPKLDSGLLKDAQSLNIRFTIQFYSPSRAEIVMESFVWKILPDNRDHRIFNLD